MQPPRLVIFTRFPDPGKAKTRLIPALGPDGAAALHRRLTEHTVAQARASELAIEVRSTGAEPSVFAEWLGRDLAVVDQGDGDLGARLQRAAAPTPVLFIGADLPDLAASHLVDAAKRMQGHDAVLGPAEDGGYWALGINEPSDFLFEAMPWGSDQVFDMTLARFRARAIEPALLPMLADCDRPEDLHRWPGLPA